MSSRNPNEKLDLQIPEDCRDLLFGPRVDETQRKIMSLDVLQYHSTLSGIQCAQCCEQVIFGSAPAHYQTLNVGLGHL